MPRCGAPTSTPVTACIALDVTSRKEWEASVDEALAEHGRIDGLVNNAGVFYGYRHFWDETDDELDHMINVNLKGTWVGTQVVSKRMADGGHPGSIVNLSSTSGVMATKGYAGYGTTRWAVRGFSKFAAGDLAAHQIRVNSLHPHGVKGTGMILASAAAAGMTDEQLERTGHRQPPGSDGHHRRHGCDRDVSAVAGSPASSQDASSWWTGESRCPAIVRDRLDQNDIRTARRIMHVSSTDDACQGHGRCYAMAPEVYTADDEGRGEVIDAEIGEDLVEQARVGALNCPESAITLS